MCCGEKKQPQCYEYMKVKLKTPSSCMMCKGAALISKLQV